MIIVIKGRGTPRIGGLGLSGPRVIGNPSWLVLDDPMARYAEHTVAAIYPLRYYGSFMKVMRETALLFLTLCLLFLNGCGKPADAAHPAGPQAFPVKVQVAQAQKVPESTDYLATVRSRNASELHPQVEGDILKIFARSGEQVAAGTPLLEIDPHRQEAAVSNQEAAYRSKLATVQYARTDLERKRKLYSAGVIAKSDLDQAQAAFDAATADAAALEAAIREQKEQLRYYTIRAPEAGVVGDIPVHVGDHVTNQTLLTTVERSGGLEAYINVPSEKAGRVRRGLPVDIVDEKGNQLLRTQIYFISPQMDTSMQTLLVKTPLTNGRQQFRNDQQVHARVIWSEHQAPVIPVTAVSRLSGKTFAFVAESNGQQAVARQRVVQLGDMIGNNYVVLDGIKPGDKIIVTGLQILQDGMPVVPQT